MLPFVGLILVIETLSKHFSTQGHSDSPWLLLSLLSDFNPFTLRMVNQSVNPHLEDANQSFYRTEIWTHVTSFLVLKLKTFYELLDQNVEKDLSFPGAWDFLLVGL